MGNQTCCQQLPLRQFNHNITIIHKRQDMQLIQVPQLSDEIVKHLEKQKPFYTLLPENPKIIRYEDDIYQGNVDNRGRPNGIGKMYHRNGSLFIGEFESGIASGQGHFVKPNGTYYHGRMFKNMADDENGYFWSPNFEYRGGIKDNQFHGNAIETGINHRFEGYYQKGKKTLGLLTWKQNSKHYEYQGSFNNDLKFEGKGRLKSPHGEYNGDFANGKKHGKGQYNFTPGYKYIGEYYHGIREGQGQLYNTDGQLSYEGRFKNGMPDGQGKTREDGSYIQTI